MTVEPTVAGYLKTASENEAEAVRHHAKYLSFIDRIDQKFRSLMVAGMGDNVVARIMVLASHAYYLAAIRSALGGQSAATFPNLRAAIESALYGLIMQEQKGADETWLNRDVDRDTCRKTFTAARGIRLLEFDPNLRALVQQAYNASIDFGAHPNPVAVMKHIRVEDAGSHYGVTLTSLHSVDSFPVEQTLIACIESGVACALIFSQVFRAQPGSKELHRSAFDLLAQFQRFLEKEGFSWSLDAD